MFTKCVKLILVGIFKVIKSILFGGQKKITDETTVGEVDKAKEKTSWEDKHSLKYREEDFEDVKRINLFELGQMQAIKQNYKRRYKIEQG